MSGQDELRRNGKASCPSLSPIISERPIAPSSLTPSPSLISYMFSSFRHHRRSSSHPRTLSRMGLLLPLRQWKRRSFPSSPNPSRRVPDDGSHRAVHGAFRNVCHGCDIAAAPRSTSTRSDTPPFPPLPPLISPLSLLQERPRTSKPRRNRLQRR